ncbi:hypothetical protein GH714_042789 [Hevea brasiliensis]|uniref:Uncharacterized protein n=1 Tax=Hevea brasiliensis TaxID=3981 RepID=A0A6A6K0I5_HEVBR|nr:hypothetical protein GH714_042789 [Hevea brasiliensis]
MRLRRLDCGEVTPNNDSAEECLRRFLASATCGIRAPVGDDRTIKIACEDFFIIVQEIIGDSLVKSHIERQLCLRQERCIARGLQENFDRAWSRSALGQDAGGHAAVAEIRQAILSLKQVQSLLENPSFFQREVSEISAHINCWVSLFRETSRALISGRHDSSERIIQNHRSAAGDTPGLEPLLDPDTISRLFSHSSNGLREVNTRLRNELLFRHLKSHKLCDFLCEFEYADMRGECDRLLETIFSDGCTNARYWHFCGRLSGIVGVSRLRALITVGSEFCAVCL